MSRITLAPNASGTGTLTVAAPNTNTDRTITLPDVTTTLVGTDATQTLTNKSIAGSQLTGTVASSLLTGALPAISGAALTDIPSGIGVSQTWQTVTGSRALNTNYTNSTGKPIMVNIMINQGSGGSGRFRVDSIDVSGQNLANVGLPAMISAIVPPSSVYQMATTSGSQTIVFWAELR